MLAFAVLLTPLIFIEEAIRDAFDRGRPSDRDSVLGGQVQLQAEQLVGQAGIRAAVSDWRTETIRETKEDPSSV